MAARPAVAGSRARGVLSLDKPRGITSFDAVREVRRIMGERRVGHAGTLDPAATGLLPICIGGATRLVDYFHAQPKTYRCTLLLGERSDTHDVEGTRVRGGDASGLTADAVSDALRQFVGDIMKVPPMHSAVRHDGRHLYELARAGEEVERQPRPATIHSAVLQAFRPGRVAEADIEVVSGKGTYMRVLAADLGEVVGTGGLLGGLSRTRYGTLDLASAISLDALSQLDDPADALLGPEVAVWHLPRVDLAAGPAGQLLRGQAVWLPRALLPGTAGECRVHGPAGELIAIGSLQAGLLRPTKVLTS